MKRVFYIFFILSFNNLLLYSQVNPNLFGFRTSSTFVFFDVQDSIFMNDVRSLTPNVLSFPGGFGNFYHLNAPGYGLNIEEIKKNHTGKKSKQASGLNRIMAKKSHNRNYIYDFIDMVKITNSSVIYDANIISSNPQEVLQVIQLFFANKINLLGVELGGELSNRAYSHFMNIEKYISLSKMYTDSIKAVYKDLPVAVVAAPNNRGSSKLENWNKKLAQEPFYDAIIVHPYAKVVKGKDVAGRMLTLIPEGTGEKEAYEIYKKRAIRYIVTDFKEEIKKYNETFHNKRIWITEWNLQMSPMTGNTLLQALFVAHQLIELASIKYCNIDIATFHNLAGRTLSGDLIMIENNKYKKNSTFNSMKIISKLFTSEFFFLHKSEVKKNFFEYCFISQKENRKLYYWINWSGESQKTDMVASGKQIEYYSENLYDKNSMNKEFIYNEIDYKSHKINIKPYSITLFEELIQ